MLLDPRCPSSLKHLPSARRPLSSGNSGDLSVGSSSRGAVFEGLRCGEGLFCHRDVGTVRAETCGSITAALLEITA